MTARALSLALTLAVVTAASSPAAQPAPTRDARSSAWIDEGIRLRAERRDEEALAQFRRAWEASQSPEARAQMALAEQALGRWTDAERDLVAAVTAGDDPWISRNRVHLDAALAEIRQHLGTLEVRCSVRGARLRVNGHEEATLPLASPLRLVIGTARVEVLAEGHVTARRELEVRPGDDLFETFELVPVDARPAVVTPAVRVTRRSVERPAHPARVWGTGLLIGAGVALVGGVTALVWREVSAGEFNATSVPRCYVDEAMPDVVYGGARCVSLRSQTETASALAIAGFVAAGALAAGGLVLLLLAPRSPRQAVAACAPGVLSITCGVVF